MLHAVEEEFPIWAANRQEVARRVIKEDNLVTIEELVSNLINKSRIRPATSYLAISLISKKPSKDNPPTD